MSLRTRLLQLTLVVLGLALAAREMALAQATAPTTVPTETVLYSFANFAPKGANPYGGVIRDQAGNLYGTTASGGTANAGVVYEVNPGGHVTTLYNFTGGADGGYPLGELIRDPAGNLYGTTVYGGTAFGGTANAGVVYRLDPGGRETVLYSFTGLYDGGNPTAGLIRDSSGNLYGTAEFGGFPYFCGVVFKVDTSGNETVLYSFTGGNDGCYPAGGVIRDSAGNFYGTTYNGGSADAGVVFKLDTTGNETVLHSFTGGYFTEDADGGYPIAGVVRDSAGNLYGTTSFGGTATARAGVVFKLDAAGNETVLHNFTGGADGGYPIAGVVLDAPGNLYGTTSNGGNLGSMCFGCGVVFRVDAAGNETVLHSFTGGDGASPQASVIQDSAGNLYGTTGFGGAGNGAVYKLDNLGRETLLYAFPPSSGGSHPAAGAVVRDSVGNLYGTTWYGGSASVGFGVLYKVNPGGHETVLHTFTGGADGSYPDGVIRDSAGNLYGTTEFGGAAQAGVVFKFTRAGNFTVLYTFTGGADGRVPRNLAIDSAGNLYGTAQFGGTADVGVLFKLDPAGHETVLHSFTGGADGWEPFGSLALDPAGNIYGTTLYGGGSSFCGVVYKVDPSGNQTVLYSFGSVLDASGHDTDGCYPRGVILDSAGNLYGTTQGGGASDWGVVYKLDTSGQETVLHSFTGGADGSLPTVVILDSAGNLYGTAQAGGLGFGYSGAGVVYKLDTSGQETVLHSFTGGADGWQPYAGVILDSAGNLYGTTQAGGKSSGGGVLFKLEP